MGTRGERRKSRLEEKEGRMEKTGHKEQPREDRTLLGRGWPERRLRQSVAVDKWGKEDAFSLRETVPERCLCGRETFRGIGTFWGVGVTFRT